MDLETEKIRLLRRKRMLDWCIKSNAPDQIFNESKQFFNDTIEQLKKLDFDAEKYINSEEEKIDYFVYCTDEEHFEACDEKCWRCHHYFMLDGNKHQEYLGCELKKTDNIVCLDFDDSGFDFSERLQKFCINRCYKCEHCKPGKYDILVGDLDMQCDLDCNRIKIYCEFYKEVKEYEKK